MNSVSKSMDRDATGAQGLIARNGVSRAVRAVVAGAMLFGAAGQAWALGLGNLEHDSYIGEPLRANIEILDSGDDYGPSEIIVRQVSSREATEKLNLDLITNNFRLKIKPYSKDGRLFVEIGSKLAIDEPFIDFLLELSWSGGQVYREYTLLMDLPPVVDAAQMAATKPRVSKPASAQQQVAPAPRVAQPSSQPGFASGTLGGSYKVKSGDTLSHIAQQWRLGSQHSLKDTEQWLFDNNAHAFANGNRNHLMLGAQLRFPTADNLPSAGLAARNQNTRAQLVAQPSTGNTAEVLSSEPQARSQESIQGDAQGQLQEEVQGRLRLGNNSTLGTEELQQKAQDPQSDEEIRDLIHITQETADRIVRENEELKRRIENIEGSEYIQNMEKLVALQRDEIEQLRLSLQQRAVPAPAAGPQATSPVVNDPVAVNEPAKIAEATQLKDAAVNDATAAVIQQNSGYSVWFWVLTVLSALLAVLIAALVSFRLGQKSRSDNEVQPLAIPETAVVSPAMDNPDVADLGPIKAPEDLGDEEIIPIELDDFDEPEAAGSVEEALEDMDLLPEDEAMFAGMSNRETVVEVPESLMVDTDLSGLNSVRLPGLVAEELDTEAVDDDKTGGVDAVALEGLGDEELSFDLELDDELITSADTTPSNAAAEDDLSFDGLEADLFKDNRDDVDELISTAMIFASFGDYDKAEELLVSESAHYIDDPRIIKALEQLARGRDNPDSDSSV